MARTKREVPLKASMSLRGAWRLWRDVFGESPASVDESFLVAMHIEVWELVAPTGFRYYRPTTDRASRTTRKVQMLLMYYCDDVHPTFAQIANHFGISPERVRQVICHLLRRLRHPRHAGFLIGFAKVKKKRRWLKGRW